MSCDLARLNVHESCTEKIESVSADSFPRIAAALCETYTQLTSASFNK